MATQLHKQPKRFSPPVLIAAIALIILLTTVPLVIVKNSDFGGTDNLAADTVTALAPEYDSGWITNWWQPAGETESALFALQAAAGGVLIGYFFGYLHGKKGGRKQEAGSKE